MERYSRNSVASKDNIGTSSSDGPAHGNDKSAKKSPINHGKSKDNNLVRKEYLFKILVVGDLGTGKTSLIKRYVHNVFSSNYKSTIGVDFALKLIHLPAEGSNGGQDPSADSLNSTLIRLQLWDIAGQERFGNMTRVYYREAVGAFVCFDQGRRQSFDEGVGRWKKDLDAKVKLKRMSDELEESGIPVVLLANKSDLDSKAVSTSELESYCQENGFCGFFETSAKLDNNIQEAMMYLVRKVLENEKKRENWEENNVSNKYSRNKYRGKPGSNDSNGGSTIIRLGRDEGNSTSMQCCSN